MCLIAFAWQMDARHPLVVAANRDEFFMRAARPAHWWRCRNRELFAGRDEQAGGTWMGITRDGRFAALTNHRDPANMRPKAPSRGALVPNFLTSGRDVHTACAELHGEAKHFNGFNLLMYDGRDLAIFESRSGHAEVLRPGIYALSNARLESPWPKQACARRALESSLARLPETTGLFDMLRCDRPAPDELLPVTGVGLQWERMLSSPFIRAPGYGTRCSSVVHFSAEGMISFEERGWDELGRPTGIMRETLATARGR